MCFAEIVNVNGTTSTRLRFTGVYVTCFVYDVL